MKMPAFDYAAPETLAEALEILSLRRGEARVLAGGQSLLPLLAFRMAAPSILIDLRKVPALDGISISTDRIELGAKVRWCDIEESTSLRATHPLLVAAIDHVAHYPIRSRGTVGGSLAHADFAAELPGIAVTCDAEIVAVSVGGTRRIPAGEFFQSPLTTTLGEDEVITTLVLPAWPTDRRWGFQEFSRQRGGFPLAGVALYYDEVDGKASNAHLTVIAANHRLERLGAGEHALNGRSVSEQVIDAVAQTAATAIDPVSDMEGSAAYRRALVRTLTARALRDSLARSASAR
jgi:aerobic carbon-monoxide dehydrogenase medium subunit